MDAEVCWTCNKPVSMIDPCSCATAHVSNNIHVFDKALKKHVNATLPAIYSYHIEDELQSDIYESSITWFVKNLMYLVLHWPSANTNAMQDHILRTVFRLAQKMHSMGGCMLRKTVSKQVIANAKTLMPTIPKMMFDALRAIHHGWKIGDHTPLGLEFTVQPKLFEFNDIYFQQSFLKDSSKRIDDFLLLPDIQTIIHEYVPVCTCKCRISAPHEESTVVGCEIRQCGDHLCCSCCSYVLCLDGMCEKCKNKKYCKLCTFECADCNMLIGLKCCRECSICEESLICRDCIRREPKVVCRKCVTQRKVPRLI